MNDKSNNKNEKKSIHPNTFPVKVFLTDGSSIELVSTSNKKEMNLDIDPLSHHAWTKKFKLDTRKDSRAAKFNNKFPGMM